MRLLIIAWTAWLLLPQSASVPTRLKSSDAHEWLEAADQHRPGHDDAALRTIAGWRGDRLMRALSAVRESPASDELNARLERAAVLHADISFVNRRDRTRPTGGWEVAGRALLVQDGRALGVQGLEPHLFFGRRIFDAMRAPFVWGAKDPEAERRRIADWQQAHKRNPRIRQWYRAVSADLAAIRSMADQGPHLHAEAGALVEDAARHFDTGCLAELIASAEVQVAVPSVSASRMNVLPLREELGRRELSQSANRGTAIDEYRKAISLDPAHDEARIRLAKVLSDGGNHREALDVLLKAPVSSPDPVVQYYAFMVTAGAHEHEGRPAEAEKAYRQATSVFRFAQSPLLALVRLTRQFADETAAREAALSFSMRPAAQSRRQDPWWEYYDCNGRNRDREVRALYALFERGAGK